jgi:hypothetical protein
MPELAEIFSHVVVDVSSISALCIRWYPKGEKLYNYSSMMDHSLVLALHIFLKLCNTFKVCSLLFCLVLTFCISNGPFDNTKIVYLRKGLL